MMIKLMALCGVVKVIEQWGHYTYPTYDQYLEHTFILPISYLSTHSYSIVVTESGDDAGEHYVK